MQRPWAGSNEADMDKVETHAAAAISGDRPVASASDDRLGFVPLAARLARALLDQASNDGLVVGVEGRWGSGKSSLLNLVTAELSTMAEAERPVVVEYQPWLIRDRDALLASLFEQLAEEIEAIELDAGRFDRRDAREEKELAERLRSYAARAETVGTILAAIPGVGTLGSLVKAAGGALKTNPGDPSLVQLKRELDRSLADLPRRIVITIDDVDRLEPREAVELLRLVRSVADFRNVIYVLCYDSEILARSIESGLNVPDGHAYLEKIVQVGIAVPIPEVFHLRRWFQQELVALASTGDAIIDHRLSDVVDREGGRRLTTPRAVIRALNALRLLIPTLNGEVDLPDLVWLQLIRIGNPPLYRWVEEYCASLAASSSWRVMISDEAKQQSYEQLLRYLQRDQLNFDSYRYELSEHLLGVKTLSFGGKKDDIPIHSRISRDELDQAIVDKRLSSPDHWRLYFALAQPATAARAADYERLLDAATSSRQAVAALMLEWFAVRDPTVGSKADVMLDRMRQRGAASLTPDQAANILLGLADFADGAYSEVGSNDFGAPSIWREAQRCIPELRKAMGPERSLEVVRAVFGEGESLGWLTDLLRHETFGHGRFGERRSDPSEWLFSDEELDAATAQMLSRYQRLTFEDFVNVPKTVSALFEWAQAGDPEGPRRLLATTMVDDQSTVRVLEGLTSLVRSSAGDYRSLQRKTLEHFLDYDAIRARIEGCAADRSSPVQERAAVLLEYFRAGEEL